MIICNPKKNFLFVVTIAAVAGAGLAMTINKPLFDVVAAGFNRPCLLGLDRMAPIPCAAPSQPQRDD